MLYCWFGFWFLGFGGVGLVFFGFDYCAYLLCGSAGVVCGRLFVGVWGCCYGVCWLLILFCALYGIVSSV